ncbi:MAG: hypothetical protein ACYDEF_09515 [Methanosarcina sp.]
MDIKISEEKEDLNKGLRRTEAGDNKRGEALQAVLEKEETLKTIINNSQVVLFLWEHFKLSAFLLILTQFIVSV